MRKLANSLHEHPHNPEPTPMRKIGTDANVALSVAIGRVTALAVYRQRVMNLGNETTNL